MTIGRSSRKGSARSSVRAPKILDKASGFYCRLEEPEDMWGGEGGRGEKAEDFGEGAMGDDGETLLQRDGGRRSSRWRRSSRRKQKETEGEPRGVEEAREAPGCQELDLQVAAAVAEGGGKEPPLVHFAPREEADDRVLIRHMKRGRDGDEEGEEERRAAREQEEGMKMVKKMTARNYRKALDRAFRRGWEAFITNLYSVTLTPVTSPSSKKEQDLDEFHVTNRPL